MHFRLNNPKCVPMSPADLQLSLDSGFKTGLSMQPRSSYGYKISMEIEGLFQVS